MRVVQLGPFPPPHGGVQTNVVAIRDYLRVHGSSCAVINITRHRKLDEDEVFYPRNAWELLKLLLRLPSDVVHLHIGGELTFRLLALALVCTLLPRRIKVLTFHSGGYPSSAGGKTARRWTLRGFVFRRLDGLIGVNQELAAVFQRLGVPKDRIRLIPPHAVPALRKRDPLPPDLHHFFEQHSPRLLSVGLLEPEYDLPLQIEALGKLRERWRGAGLILIGSGSLSSELAETIRSKPYASHILLCGDAPHETTLQAMATSDLLLRTTRYDGDSVAVREALHLGIPVVATDNGMRPEGVNLVPIGDLDSVVKTAASCLDGQKRCCPVPACPAGEENIAAVLRFYSELAGQKNGSKEPR